MRSLRLYWLYGSCKLKMRKGVYVNTKVTIGKRHMEDITFQHYPKSYLSNSVVWRIWRSDICNNNQIRSTKPLCHGRCVRFPSGLAKSGGFGVDPKVNPLDCACFLRGAVSHRTGTETTPLAVPTPRHLWNVSVLDIVTQNLAITIFRI